MFQIEMLNELAYCLNMELHESLKFPVDNKSLVKVIE